MKYLLLHLSFICTICSCQDIQVKNKSGREIHFTVRINLNFPDNDSDSPEIKDKDSVYYDQAVLILPETYTSGGKPTRLIYCAHGAGGGVDEDSWFLSRYALDDTLLANGYAIFDVNGGPSLENMGGSRAIQSAYKAYCFIRENYNVYDEIFVSGFSMGGLSSTNFVYKHPGIVLAHGMFSPVLDLQRQAWENPWYSTTRKAIASAFGFKDPSGNNWEEKKVTGWNPFRINTFSIGKDTLKIYHVPVKIWHGTADRAVDINYSRNFMKYILNSGSYCELREIRNGDHGLSCGSPALNHEIVLFFKRFDN